MTALPTFWDPVRTDAAYDALIAEQLPREVAAERLGVTLGALQGLIAREGWSLAEERAVYGHRVRYFGPESRQALERADRRFVRALHKEMLKRVRASGPVPAHAVKGSGRRQPTERQRRVIVDVAAAWGVTPDDILGADRSSRCYRPRQDAYFQLHRVHGYSLPAIGAVFDRDHTTVLHGVRSHEKRMAEVAMRGEGAK